MAVFGFENTTDEVLEGVDLTGKVALVTGASGGLGEETVRALASKGCQVIIAARDKAKSTQVAESIKASTANSNISVVALELTDRDSIRACAEQVQQSVSALHILINNAGVMACPLKRTADGCEFQFGTCHIGHFLLTNLLLPLLIKGAEESGDARVVNLSSGGHKYGGVDFDDVHWQNREYNKWLAYGQAKTANALFSVGLENRLGEKGVHSYAVHPGVIHTDLGRHLEDKDIEELMEGARGAATMKMKSIPQGAATSVWAATSTDLQGKGGLYLEDCHVAEEDATGADGYCAYALDKADADRLWQVSEEILGQQFSW